MAKKKALIAEIFNQRVDAWLAKYPSMDIRETKYIDLFGQIPLSELLVYDIHRSELAVTGKDGKVDIPTPKEFKKAFDRLADNALIYGTPDDDEDWMRINIIGSVKWDKFNPWMAFKFTKSKYTFSFYQWCCQWKKKGTFELSVKELKFRLKLDEYRDSDGKLHKEKYKLMKDFILYVIEPAKDELQELFDAGDCDVCFEYEPSYDKSRPGKPVVIGFNFTVVKKENKQIPPPQPQPMQESLFTDARSRLDWMVSTLMYYWSNSYDKEWPKRAIKELGWKITSDAKLLDKVELFIKDTIHDAQKGKVQNVPGTIHEYFKKKLDIVVDKKTTTKGGAR